MSHILPIRDWLSWEIQNILLSSEVVKSGTLSFTVMGTYNFFLMMKYNSVVHSNGHIYLISFRRLSEPGVNFNT